MRATKGYVAGVGTTGALVGAIGCAFAVLSTVVAVQGWPLALTPPSVATLEERAPSGGDALVPLTVFPTAAPARSLAPSGAPASGRTAQVLSTRLAQRDGGPLAGTFGPAAEGPALRGTDGGVGRVPQASPGASAASPAPGAGGGSTPSPVQPGTGSGGSGSGGSGASTPPASGSSSSPSLGGTVTQVTSGAGTTVSQTGQQLSGAVQGTTGQLGGVVGQVSPSAGQVVTQTGQLAGGVVSGATGTAGQVVSGAGAAVGRLLGGLGRTRSG
jgi:hypothetical protein